MRSSIRSWACALLLCAPLAAQSSGRGAPAVLRALETPARAAAPSVAVVLGPDGPVALGTVVDASGLILTKASELGETVRCRLSDGASLGAQILARDPNYDLALLKVPREGLTPVTPAPSAARRGQLVFGVTEEGRVLGLGVVGVVPRMIRGGRGRLGLVLDFGEEAPVVARVTQGTPAALVGLRTGDRILSIDGTETPTRTDATRVIRRRGAGTTLALRVDRGGHVLELNPILAGRALGRDGGRDARMQGDQSAVRGGFPSALQHDVVLSPEECGGPLVDLKGRLVALNIARAGRVASYAIPAAELTGIVERLRAQANTAADAEDAEDDR